MRALLLSVFFLACAACDKPGTPVPGPAPGPKLQAGQLRVSIDPFRRPGITPFGFAALSPRFSVSGRIVGGSPTSDLDALSGLVPEWGWRYELVVEEGEPQNIQGHRFQELTVVRVIEKTPAPEGETFTIPLNADFIQGSGEDLSLIDGKAFRCKDSKVTAALEAMRKLPTQKGRPLGAKDAQATFAFGASPKAPLTLVALKLP